MEHLAFSKQFHSAGEPQFSRTESAFQAGDELAAKHAAQHSHRQEESVAWVYPALVNGRKAAGRDHAMDMRMDLQILSPGVENAEESDLRTQMFGIGGDLQQRRGAGAE